MNNDINLTVFQSQVEEEILVLSIPGQLVAARAQELLHMPPPEIQIRGLLPELGQVRKLDEHLWMQQLEQELIDQHEKLLVQLIALEPENPEWHEIRKRLKKQKKATPETLEKLWEKRQDVATKKANALIAKKEIRASLCRALKIGFDDTFEISKIITPILIGLAVAGTISIPFVPILFASIALMIARMGVAGLCPDKNDDKRDVKKK